MAKGKGDHFTPSSQDRKGPVNVGKTFEGIPPLKNDTIGGGMGGDIKTTNTKSRQGNGIGWKGAC